MMKTHWTKKELIAELEEFSDDDVIVINIHDDVFFEDNYQFYFDPIWLGVDKDGNDLGHELQLCPVQNVEKEEHTAEDIEEKLRHYYEVDINNCEMTHELWIKELAKAMTSYSYLNDFLFEHNEYLEERQS